MTTNSARATSTRLGLTPEAAGWCTLLAIPAPPKDVHVAAGGGRLRPAFIRPLGALGYVGAWLLAPFVLLSAAEDVVEQLLAGKAARARAKAKAKEDKELKEAIVTHGLDRAFDGDWSAAAGQFLLRWYGHSPHHRRLLVLTPERLVLAAPPRRVSVREAEQTQIVADIRADEAVVEDPLRGRYAHDRLRIRFGDGSWLTVVTDKPRGDIHMHLMRRPRLGGRTS
ncbi:hypothetical protein [Streptomyces sp. NPDC002328]|uniref:hypothetical protein n=1 Tax=Streptomyces sp. NPDC002328 TaxID=3364642 RepID=UPI0036A7F47C